VENKYKFNLVWSDEDGGYIATCPEFVGLSAFGETPEEALAEAKVALSLFIETFQKQGLPLPEPQTVQTYSGQIRLRLPKSLHARAAKMAAEDGVSLNQHIILAVEARTAVGDEKRKVPSEAERPISAVNPPSEYRKNKEKSGRKFAKSNKENRGFKRISH
jgi:predicted RNase H-like HicB family nuclease